MTLVFLAVVGIGVYMAFTQAWWWFFLPIGGLVLLSAVGWIVTSLLRPGWHGFVGEWEKREGTLRATSPAHRLAPMQLAYSQWRRARKSSGESATEWLERNGYPSHPEPGETKITSGWEFAVRPFDEEGVWLEDGSLFAATRSFAYEVGGAFGSGAGYTHLESCGHLHASQADSLSCLEALRRQSERPPSLGDIAR